MPVELERPADADHGDYATNVALRLAGVRKQPPREIAGEIAAEAVGRGLAEKAEAAERALSEELDRIVVKSVIYTSGEQDPRVPVPRPDDGRRVLMGPDPRLVRMPDRPTLFDFFRYRFRPATHLLQSARLAQRSGASEKIVLACLLHDIAILGFIRGDHGYWAAQLVAPYVDEEVSWAIRYHQALRFYPDPANGYEYPELYTRIFGKAYVPQPHIKAAYDYARNHKWYLDARMVTVNDLYAFDPNAKVSIEPFTDIIGRHFKQPKEGLGNDNSPTAHMWRTMMFPDNPL